ncbi:Cytochrome c oxidase subunit 5b-2 mitochondrial [Zea mays]|uniref:Cytochrome c oxidase subunit 5b-2 mitochondrial n=1 Tax=Zea mays TaxID=4577 RepID=A0A1D6FLC0_MAIZE|nr:Cytochrome c oxidase subunit 5b-2 mitochondrial [Zea mays]
MWRRLQTLAPSLRRAAASSSPASARAVPLSTVPVAAFRRTSTLLSSPGDKPAPSKVEDVMPIATGLEREELEAELQGKKRFDMDPAVGPFGTKAVIESYYNKRIVGCPGAEGEDEHDVVWFWLEKDKPHECLVCSRYFVLKVIGDGGDPDGHDDEDDHH